MKTILKYPTLCLLLMLFAGRLCAQDGLPDSLQAGDQAYREERFMEARAKYEWILEQQFESAGLYYNLGNACFKSGDMASAILYYQRSLRLRPGDENTLFNLRVAQSRTVDKIDEVPQPFYKRGWAKLSGMMPADHWAVWLIAMLTLCLLSAALYLLAARVLYRKLGFWLAVVFLLFTILGNFLAYTQYAAQTGDSEAVVFEQTLHVKASPDDQSNDVFVLHEGTCVSIRDKIGDWYEIRIANGNVGWIPAETVRII